MRTPGQLYRAVGLMSGTSMDGIDVALLETDGESSVLPGPWMSEPYPTELRRALLEMSPGSTELVSRERQMTDMQTELVRRFLLAQRLDTAAIDCIGFHGQTIKHEPRVRRTWQLGDGARMAKALGCVVVNRFRDADLEQGGQGAPLVPAYHQALVRSQRLAQPVAIINIGGVSNITMVAQDTLRALDCGPGNALIDDWMQARVGARFDTDGRLAATGHVNEPVLTQLLSDPYFSVVGAKSLDRNHFSLEKARALSNEDGAATLTAFTARAIALAARAIAISPARWIVVGGGRYNLTLLSMLRAELDAPVETAEQVGWSGDAIEAQAFAYLAVRSILGLPLSWPSTTGVRQPTTGGVRHEPDRT